MLARLIDLALAHRLVVLAATLAAAAAGAVSLVHLPLDAFPDTSPVQVQVNAVAPALAPAEVERLLTIPLEQALAGVGGVRELRSISKFGFAQVVLVFADGTDVWLARQQVAERLPAVDLPDGVPAPLLGPVSSGLGEVFHYVVSGDRSLAELRTVQDWMIAPRLRAVPGVAEVNTWGGIEAQVHVVVDPLELHARGLDVGDVARALAAANRNVGGGRLARAGSARIVQGVGALASRDEVASVVIDARDGVPVRIGDVARVEAGGETRLGAVTAGGRGEAVLGLGFMRPGENSRDVTRALAARLDEVRPSLPAGVTAEAVYERTDLVDRVLATVRRNLLEAAVLVVVVLLVFLGDVRAGLVVAAVIPLAFLCAGSVMRAAGIAGTLMSLGAIDFGLVVDSSVIVVENAVRRLAGAGPGADVRAVVRDAAVEVRRPTLYGELIILIVYLPVLALTGVEGKLFRPMALTLIAILACSMVLSLTTIPVLASLALGRRRGAAAHHEPAVVRLAKRLYLPVLDGALARPRLVLAVALAALAAGTLGATRLGAEFVPRLHEQAIAINAIRLASVSLEESVRIGTRIERILLESFPDEVAHVWTRTGTAEVATDPMGLELSDVFVTLRPREEWRRARTQQELVAAMRGRLSDLPGMRLVFSQPVEMRLNEMVAGARADVVLEVYGDDLDGLRRSAEQAAASLGTVPGAASVTVEQVIGAPVFRVEVDRAALARNGVEADRVLDLVAALAPVPVGEVWQGERRVPLAIRLADSYRDVPERLGDVPVPAAGGGSVRLGELARIATSEGPSTIQREHGRRRIQVLVSVATRDVQGWVDEARRRLARELELPPGGFVEWGGQFEHLERARARLMIVTPVALGLVFLLLFVAYGRASDALRVFTGVPFAAVGGIAALHLRGLPFSVPAGVGFIALAGVAVLADMVLVTTARQLMRDGLDARSAVRAAAERRLRPVLMTALVASLGFLPMALNTGVGAEVQRPLATVLIGGLATSTLLSLVVLPVLFARLAGARGGTGAAAAPAA